MRDGVGQRGGALKREERCCGSCGLYNPGTGTPGQSCCWFLCCMWTWPTSLAKTEIDGVIEGEIEFEGRAKGENQLGRGDKISR